MGKVAELFWVSPPEQFGSLPQGMSSADVAGLCLWVRFGGAVSGYVSEFGVFLMPQASEVLQFLCPRAQISELCIPCFSLRSLTVGGVFEK